MEEEAVFPHSSFGLTGEEGSGQGSGWEEGRVLRLAFTSKNFLSILFRCHHAL
jgi:hypothetical protein